MALSVLAIAVTQGAPSSALLAGALPFACVAVGVISAWRSVGRDLVSPRQLACAPLYVLWKIPLYVSMWTQGAPARWERTAREQKE